jgi:plastocyanin
MGMRHVVCVLVAGLAFCAGGCASQQSKSLESAPHAAVVEMHLHSFEPRSVSIHAGEAVLWHNGSLIWHTVTADPAQAKRPEDVALPAGAAAFDSDKVPAGDSYRQVFAVPGTYRYFCRPHELKGMVGEVVVLPAAGSR